MRGVVLGLRQRGLRLRGFELRVRTEVRARITAWMGGPRIPMWGWTCGDGHVGITAWMGGPRIPMWSHSEGTLFLVETVRIRIRVRARVAEVSSVSVSA